MTNLTIKKYQRSVIRRTWLISIPRHVDAEGVVVDHAWRIEDAEALQIVFDLITEEGLCLGGSSGINIAGAMRLARELGPGKTIVTVLCDYGSRYQSKMFNCTFLESKGLPVPAWL